MFSGKIIRSILFALTLLLMTSPYCEAQDYEFGPNSFSHAGLGLGIPYGGGIGARFVYNPSKSVGLMFGAGYSFVDLGYSAGLMFGVPTEKKTQVYFSGMYGINAIILVIGASELNRQYAGISVGTGVKISFNRRDYLDVGLVLPFRSTEYENEWDNLKSSGQVTNATDPLPIAINVGYSFRL